MALRLDEALVNNIGELLLNPRHQQMTTQLGTIEADCKRQLAISKDGQNGHLCIKLEDALSALRQQAVIEECAKWISFIEVLREKGEGEQEILTRVREEVESYSADITRETDTFSESFVDCNDPDMRLAMLANFSMAHSAREGTLTALRFILTTVKNLLNPKKGW